MSSVASTGARRIFNTDDGFGSNNYIVDLNGDDFAEAISATWTSTSAGVTADCTSITTAAARSAGSSASSRSDRAAPMAPGPALRGTHDVAIFDIDNDGDRDMVVGRCSGTRVYLNERNALGVDYCEAMINSTGQSARLRVEGSPYAASNDVTLRADRLPPGQFGIFLVSPDRGFVPNPGNSAGNLCLGAPLGRFVGPGQIVAASAAGEFSVAIDLTLPLGSSPVAAEAGDTFSFTAWFGLDLRDRHQQLHERDEVTSAEGRLQRAVIPRERPGAGPSGRRRGALPFPPGRSGVAARRPASVWRVSMSASRRSNRR